MIQHIYSGQSHVHYEVKYFINLKHVSHISKSFFIKPEVMAMA